MRIALCSLIVGILTIRFLPYLPSRLFFITVGCFGILLLPWRFYPLGMLLLGLGWGGIAATYAIDDRIGPQLDGETMWIDVRVEGLPEYSEKVIRFQVSPTANTTIKLPKQIRLSWYKGSRVATGEYWRLKIRLRYPRGTVNSNTFDYEQWLTAKHIGATGTVKEGYLLEQSYSIYSWRYLLKEKINSTLPENISAGIVALVLGDGSGLTKEQWQILQETGTVHLMVISGQHITLLAGFIYFIVVCLVRFGFWPRNLPWSLIACSLAMIGALLYGFLAGFEVSVYFLLVLLVLLAFIIVYLNTCPFNCPHYPVWS